MRPFHYMSGIFSVVWLSHFEYEMAEVDDHELVESMISEDYAKYSKSFSAQMDLTIVECIQHFLNNELDK